MEARIGDEGQHFYGFRGKRSVEWDLNDWKWDGDLFVATQLNHHHHHHNHHPNVAGRQFFPLGNSSNSSSSCSEEGNNNNNNNNRKRGVVVEGESSNGNGNGNGNGLSLKIGDDVGAGKKAKFVGGGTSRAVCQVENCEADLSKVKDYHRRHKVCEMHSKATSAVVGGIMQRFCQQCSR